MPDAEPGSIGNLQTACLPSIPRFGHESGEADGTRRFSVRRQDPREAGYLAATSAIRWHPDMFVPFDRLRARGTKHIVTLVAVMGQEIISVSGLLRDGHEWPQQVQQPTISHCE